MARAEEIRIGERIVLVRLYREIISHDLPNGIVGFRVECKLDKRNKGWFKIHLLYQVCGEDEDYEKLQENTNLLFCDVVGNVEDSDCYDEIESMVIKLVDNECNKVACRIISGYRKNLNVYNSKK